MLGAGWENFIQDPLFKDKDSPQRMVRVYEKDGTKVLAIHILATEPRLLNEFVVTPYVHTSLTVE